MTARERGEIRARRIAREQLAAVAKEVRQARLRVGRSQLDVARAAGISTSALSRIELGTPVGLRLEDVAAACAAVGLDVSLKTYPGAQVLEDAAQVRLLRELRDRLGPGWRWRFEVSVAPGDQRSWDMRGRHATGVAIAVDAETRVRDLQSVFRRVGGKPTPRAAQGPCCSSPTPTTTERWSPRPATSSQPSSPWERGGRCGCSRRDATLARSA